MPSSSTSSSSSGNIFMDCATQQQQAQSSDGGNDNTTAILLMQCVSDYHEQQSNDREQNLRSFLLIICGGMIFFMQSGFAMLCAGSVRLKNVQNTMLKNLLDACGAALSFYLVGYALAFGGDYDYNNLDSNSNPTTNSTATTTFVGTTNFASVGPSSAYWFFEYTFSATSVTIVAGTLAERCQMAAYLAYSVALAGFIYPVIAHSIWSNEGFLSRTNYSPFMDSGVIDFAGGGVVHLNGGLIALYATLVLGPRRGRFYDPQGEPLVNPQPFPGHSVALQLLGTMILWFGWFGFNPGSALLLVDNHEFGQVAANAAVATALSGASGGITALFTNLWWEERVTGEPKFVIQMAMNGALSGLVAVTSGCAVMEPWAAIITGVIAGWLYMLSSTILIKLKIDDAVNAIPVHMVNGGWGLISTGLFASPKLLQLTYGNADHPGFFYTFNNNDGTGVEANLLLCQFCAILFILGWTFITMFPFFIWLNYRGWLRADSLEELVGLDVSYHGRGTHGSEGGDHVQKEYIDAYNRYKSTIRHRHHGQNNSNPDRQQATTVEATTTSALFPQHPNNANNGTGTEECGSNSFAMQQHDEEQQQQQQQQQENLLSGGEQEQHDDLDFNKIK